MQYDFFKRFFAKHCNPSFVLQTHVVTAHLTLRYAWIEVRWEETRLFPLLTARQEPLHTPSQEFAHSVYGDQFLTESGYFSGTEVVLVRTVRGPWGFRV